jgi:hypothetical protein
MHGLEEWLPSIHAWPIRRTSCAREKRVKRGETWRSEAVLRERQGGTHLGRGRRERIDGEGGRAVSLGAGLTLVMGHVSAHRAHLALPLLVVVIIIMERWRCESKNRPVRKKERKGL